MPHRRPGIARAQRYRLHGGLTAALFAALLAGACAPKTAGCSRTAETPIAFPGEGARAVARTIGDSCDHAIGILVLEAEDGHPAWAWTAPLHPTFGSAFEARVGDTPNAEDADAFLSRWAQVRVTLTSAAPPWPAREDTVAGGGHTTLDRATYEDIRARALPMACHLSGVARETCVFWEPAAAAAAPLVEHDVSTN